MPGPGTYAPKNVNDVQLSYSMGVKIKNLSSVKSNSTSYSGGYSSRSVQNPYSMDVGGRSENINWLL